MKENNEPTRLGGSAALSAFGVSLLSPVGFGSAAFSLEERS